MSVVWSDGNFGKQANHRPACPAGGPLANDVSDVQGAEFKTGSGRGESVKSMLLVALFERSVTQRPNCCAFACLEFVAHPTVSIR